MVFVFVRVHINDEVFLVQILTFPEKLFLLYSIVSCQDVYHSGSNKKNVFFINETSSNRVPRIICVSRNGYRDIRCFIFAVLIWLCWVNNFFFLFSCLLNI